MANNADINAKVEGLLKSHQDGVGIVSACKQLLAMLVDAKIAYRLTIPSLLVGVHPTNRDGYGVNAMDMHTLMDDIFAIGWDSSKVSALCSELSSHDEQAIKQFNQKLVLESNGLLAPDHSEQMRYSSLWGGGTQIRSSVPSNVASATQIQTCALMVAWMYKRSQNMTQSSVLLSWMAFNGLSFQVGCFNSIQLLRLSSKVQAMHRARCLSLSMRCKC